MKRKLIAIFMTIAMLTTMVPAAFAADESDPIIADYSWYEGVSGSSYTISDVADLVGLANIVNGNYSTEDNFQGDTITLAGDIDCQGAVLEPIGNWDHPFKGIFDGDQNTISNASINGDNNTIRAGLFGMIQGNKTSSSGTASYGIVKNITFDSVILNNTSTTSNGDAYEAASGIAVATMKSAMVSNITVNNNCSVHGVYRTGGIVGDSREYNDITGCTNNAPVYGTSNYTGGILGAAHDILSWLATTTTTIKQCTNNALVEGTNEVGGIVGYSDRAKIDSCNNAGTVSGTGNYGTGGILGCDIYNYKISIFKPSCGSTILNCGNTGDISAPRAGGILGSFVVAPSKNQPSSTIYSTITGCTSSGAISCMNNNGICGAVYGAPITYKSGDASTYVDKMIVKIENCKVGGSVNGVDVPSDESALNTFISPSPYVSLSGNTKL